LRCGDCNCTNDDLGICVIGLPKTKREKRDEKIKERFEEILPKKRGKTYAYRDLADEFYLSWETVRKIVKK
jgi:hypothetical protein